MHKLFSLVWKHNFKPKKINIRNFLSEAYRCNEIWNKRFSSPILQKVRLDELSINLDQKFNRQDPVSAIDIDVFTNALNQDSYSNELREFLHKFRLTPETGNMLESTRYAAVRYFIDNRKYEELLIILDDRLNYGLFLDSITGNMLLDDLIKMKDFASAAKVATFFMLQEDFENSITENLSLYACYKYLKNLEPDVVKDQTEVEEKPQSKKKKEEEIKVRVKYLRNPYFDDHFDLSDMKLLSGKTLSMIGKQYTDPFNTNIQFLGWLFYKKLDKLQEVAKNIVNDKILEKDTLELLKKSFQLAYINRDEETLKACRNILADFEKIGCLETQKNMEEIMIEKIDEALKKHQEEHITHHSQLFDGWESVRESKFKEQIKILEENKILEERRIQDETLRRIEEKIWFIDNEEKVDLKIEQKRANTRAPPVIKKKKKDLEKEEYIPPEVKSRKSL